MDGRHYLVVIVGWWKEGLRLSMDLVVCGDILRLC